MRNWPRNPAKTGFVDPQLKALYKRVTAELQQVGPRLEQAQTKAWQFGTQLFAKHLEPLKPLQQMLEHSQALYKRVSQELSGQGGKQDETGERLGMTLQDLQGVAQGLTMMPGGYGQLAFGAGSKKLVPNPLFFSKLGRALEAVKSSGQKRVTGSVMAAAMDKQKVSAGERKATFFDRETKQNWDVAKPVKHWQDLYNKNKIDWRIRQVYRSPKQDLAAVADQAEWAQGKLALLGYEPRKVGSAGKFEPTDIQLIKISERSSADRYADQLKEVRAQVATGELTRKQANEVMVELWDDYPPDVKGLTEQQFLSQHPDSQPLLQMWKQFNLSHTQKTVDTSYDEGEPFTGEPLAYDEQFLDVLQNKKFQPDKFYNRDHFEPPNIGAWSIGRNMTILDPEGKEVSARGESEGQQDWARYLLNEEQMLAENQATRTKVLQGYSQRELPKGELKTERDRLIKSLEADLPWRVTDTAKLKLGEDRLRELSRQELQEAVADKLSPEEYEHYQSIGIWHKTSHDLQLTIDKLSTPAQDVVMGSQEQILISDMAKLMTIRNTVSPGPASRELTALHVVSSASQEIPFKYGAEPTPPLGISNARMEKNVLALDLSAAKDQGYEYAFWPDMLATHERWHGVNATEENMPQWMKDRNQWRPWNLKEMLKLKPGEMFDTTIKDPSGRTWPGKALRLNKRIKNRIDKGFPLSSNQPLDFTTTLRNYLA